MDAVTVSYAIYTQPEADADYASYLSDSLAGLAAVLRPGGVLILNTRDWPALMASTVAGVEHHYRNTHGETSFSCRYKWQFGENRLHQTTLVMWEDGGAESATEIWFAERSPGELEHALHEAGLATIETAKHGEGPYAFYTIIARKS